MPSILRVLLLGLVILGFVATPAPACGPYAFTVNFSDARWPDDLEAYLAGDLGVLGEHYDSRLLWVAYRHLRGLPVTEEQKALLPYRYRSTWGGDRAPEAWAAARNAIPGVEEKSWSWFDVRREVVRVSEDYEYREYVINCLDDAFLTAIQTLEQRVESFGAESSEVAAWLKGQDLVFDNCEEGQHLPAEPQESWPKILQQDRAYQIAAAYFYSEGYGEAERRFREIAADENSSWSELAHYLVARALARQGRHGEAVEQLDAVLENPSLGRWHGPARGLRDHYLHHHDPEAMRHILAQRLGSGDVPETFDQDLEDLQWVLDLDTESDDDLMSWLRLLKRAVGVWSGPDAGDVDIALGRWRDGGGAHWWLAAAMIQHHDHGVAGTGHDLGRPGSRISDLLEKVPPAEGPGRLSILFHRLRLEHLSGRLDTPENEKLLSTVLAEDLSLSNRNRFLGIYRYLAPDLDTFLQRSLRRPDSGTYDDGGSPGPDYEESGLPEEGVFDVVAAGVLDRMSPGRLYALADAPWLPEKQRGLYASIAWLRDVLRGDWTRVVEEADRAAKLAPDLAKAIRATVAGDEESLPFQAAFAVLQYPGWDPHVHPIANGEGTYTWLATGTSWWCGDQITLDSEPGVPGPGRPGSSPEAEQLTIEAAPLHFAPAIFAFAEAHPDDPRVPEALHYLVRSTRFSCGTGLGNFAEISRRAFRLLHRRYAKSSWTEKTPYWFE